MPAANATDRGASLRIFMDELMAAEQNVVDVAQATPSATGQLLPQLAHYRWRRPAMQMPALYHTLLGADTQYPQVGVIRDVPSIATRIAVPFGDDGYEFDGLMESYLDIYRQVMDPLTVDLGNPLNGAATFMNRTGMTTLLDEIGGTPYLAGQFAYTFRFDRVMT